jgi:hypothetical protein
MNNLDKIIQCIGIAQFALIGITEIFKNYSPSGRADFAV